VREREREERTHGYFNASKLIQRGEKTHFRTLGRRLGALGAKRKIVIRKEQKGGGGVRQGGAPHCAEGGEDRLGGLGGSSTGSRPMAATCLPEASSGRKAA
jgi:hypothetical protein